MKKASAKPMSMKEKALKAGDSLRAKLSSMRPAVERIGDRVQTMTGRKPAPKKGAAKSKKGDK